MGKISKKVTRSTIVETKHRLVVSQGDLIDLLRSIGHTEIPDNPHCYIDVPGGGDWSNSQLNID